MCLLLETIKVENGQIRNLDYHNRRFNSSRMALFGNTGKADLSSLITIPDDQGPGIFRCRVLYGREIEKVEFHPYRPRTIRSLKLLNADQIDYSHKYADRNLLESLFKQRAACDEILVVKNAYITDTSVSNIVFRLTDGSWVTPDTPLLRGTMRMYLLEAGKISEQRIGPDDLSSFTEARLINCMMNLETGPVIEMEQIIS